MPFTTYRNRKAFEFSNDKLSVTVSVEGGHIASILHKASGVNPLWVPIWPSIEPSAYDAKRHPEYGEGNEAKLLAGILGHNLCLDLFGGPSEEELAAGIYTHGEANLVGYSIDELPGGNGIAMRCVLPQAGLQFERMLRLPAGSDVLRIRETVTNLTACDRPIAWTQHVTLGPPFLERGVTQFRAPGTRSRVIESDFTEGRGAQKTGADFDWPLCPRKDGGQIDLRVYTAEAVSAGFTTTLMDPHRAHAFFLAFQPKSQLLFGYIWNRSDFPWLGRWEENHLRTHKPWVGKSLTLGMEFGASPFPESRRQMIERGKLFSMPGYRWLPAMKSAIVEYCAFAITRASIPDNVEWDGETGLSF
jgi:hypothetical protein